MLTREQMLNELKSFAVKWYEAKLKKSDLEDFYDGCFMGASSALRWAGIVTDDELERIESEAKEKAENEIEDGKKS